MASVVRLASPMVGARQVAPAGSTRAGASPVGLRPSSALHQRFGFFPGGLALRRAHPRSSARAREGKRLARAQKTRIYETKIQCRLVQEGPAEVPQHANFSVFVIAALAQGIGVNTAIFSLIHLAHGWRSKQIPPSRQFPRLRPRN